MRSRVVLVGLVGLVMLVTIFRTRHVSAFSSPTVPFTITVMESHFKSDGTLGHVEEVVWAFRSDGSFVRSTHRVLPNGKVFEIKDIEDIPNRKRVIVDDATHSMTTYPLQNIDVQHFADIKSACTSDQEGERSSILGHVVVLRHDGHKLTDGRTRVLDRWEAPDLNCFPLRDYVTAAVQPGVSYPHNEQQATKITMGEPDISFFTIPEGFVERSPSQRQAEFQRLYGVTMPPDPAADRSYASARAK